MIKNFTNENGEHDQIMNKDKRYILINNIVACGNNGHHLNSFVCNEQLLCT